MRGSENAAGLRLIENSSHGHNRRERRKAARIYRPCLDCGTIVESPARRCIPHARKHEAARQARQPYRLAYRSEEYQAARREAKARARGQCEAMLGDGSRCPARGTEAHHLDALSASSSIQDAIGRSSADRLAWVCRRHNPRGPQSSGKRRRGR